MHEQHRRFFTTARELQLPLHMESIGYNPEQERFSRPDGYPCYHWLQTLSGEGRFIFGDTAYQLKPHT